MVREDVPVMHADALAATSASATVALHRAIDLHRTTLLHCWFLMADLLWWHDSFETLGSGPLDAGSGAGRDEELARAVPVHYYSPPVATRQCPVVDGAGRADTVLPAVMLAGHRGGLGRGSPDQPCNLQHS
jgi:hypothetical protein